jgi:hypothetical protein
MDDARPAWNENAPPLSDLIFEASQRIFGDNLGRMRCCIKKERIEYLYFLLVLPKQMSGGVVDGWFNNGLN